ncbi:MAG: hypothetical protein EYC70_02995 [Planctomycetota bacterium]|nr:MAG: hypothetical protein EYC70_02995 [Planctomycetota bacterium]
MDAAAPPILLPAAPPRRSPPDALVRRLRRDEESQALRLYHEAGVSAPHPEVWRWRLYERDPDNPLIAAAFEPDGRLAGLYPASLRPIRIRGRDAWAVQACWSVVHPGARWSGRVFRLLARHTREQGRARGAVVGFGGGVSSAAAVVGARLAAYRTLLRLEVRERRLSWRLALQRRAGWAGLAAAALADHAFDWSLRRRSRALEVSVAADAGAEFDELWERERDSFPVLLRRDARELRWRWFRCPLPAVVLAARRHGRLCGYAVLRHHAEGAGELTTVLDLFCGRDLCTAQALLHASARLARAHGSDFLRFAPVPSSPAHATVHGRAWRSARKDPDHVVISPLQPDGVPAPVLDGACWYYAQGDADFLD